MQQRQRLGGATEPQEDRTRRRRLRGPGIGMGPALQQEYRFTARSLEKGDFIEGVRAAIIDKDRSPNWQHADWDVPQADVEAMLAPLGDNELKLEENS